MKMIGKEFGTLGKGTLLEKIGGMRYGHEFWYVFATYLPCGKEYHLKTNNISLKSF